MKAISCRLVTYLNQQRRRGDQYVIHSVVHRWSGQSIPSRRSSSTLLSSHTTTSGPPFRPIPTRTTTTLTSTPAVVEQPTRSQLTRVFINAAIPMIGFGFMDQTVMLQAGNAIDCTIGVTFGLSTLTAAAFGQICSDASGVLFGGTLESLFERLGWGGGGLQSLTMAQQNSVLVRRLRLAGSLVGVVTGCALGLLNLVLIDTERSSTLKLQALNEEQEFEFQIEASNAARNGVTCLTVRGPDVDGILASMTAALAVRGCSLVELHAGRRINSDRDEIEDVFYVLDRETGKPFDDDDLEDLAMSLLDSTRTPMNVTAVKSRLHELEHLNANLKARIHKLEQVVREKQITVIPTPHQQRVIITDPLLF